MYGAPGGEEGGGEVAAVPAGGLREHLLLDERGDEAEEGQADCAADGAGVTDLGEEGSGAAGDEGWERGACDAGEAVEEVAGVGLAAARSRAFLGCGVSFVRGDEHLAGLFGGVRKDGEG